MVDKKIVKKVAELAKLYLKEGEEEQLAEHFRKILQDFQSLQSVDTSGVEPLRTPAPSPAPLRQDAVNKKITVDEIMQNAPDKKGGLFKVPPVV